MKGSNLGEFEELVLLTVCVLAPEAYGVGVMETISKESDRNVSIGAVHSALNRLEDKGFVQSAMGEATPERGGRRKRLFMITPYGQEALLQARALRTRLWHMIPDGALGRT